MPLQLPDSADRMARMPSRLCRCTAATGPLTGKAVLDSSAQSCSNRFSRSILEGREEVNPKQVGK